MFFRQEFPLFPSTECWKITNIKIKNSTAADCRKENFERSTESDRRPGGGLSFPGGGEGLW